MALSHWCEEPIAADLAFRVISLTGEASVVENKALVQQLRRLLDADEFDAASDLLSEDVRWWYLDPRLNWALTAP